MASFSFDYANECDVGGFNVSDNEDIFIEDLSEFSNEDIAAPIEGDFDSPLQQPSDSNSDCSIVTTHTSLSVSDVFHHSELDLKTAAFLGHQIKESIFCFSDKDEAGFEWLDSLGNDNLIHSIASNLDMDSLSSTMPSGGTFDGMLKQTEYENAILTEQEMEMMQNFMKATCAMTPECQQADHGTCSTAGSHVAGLQTCDAIDFAAPSTTMLRLPRSKRTRRVSGWSSGSILSKHQTESQSPTHSLESSASQGMEAYAFEHNHCTIGIICNQKEGCTTGSYETNIKIKSDASIMIENPNGDNCKNLGSDEKCVNEEGTTRVENSYGGGSVHPRRCTHCLSQKTPQWRAGPMGPKTLCNACGVQYKYGRLFEEYRPAKSPTFLSYKHSNSHKQVMEMRRKALYHKHQTLHHCVQASMVMKTKAGHQPMIDKFTIKLQNSPLWAQIELPCGTHISDATLIRTRTASEPPPNFLC